MDEERAELERLARAGEWLKAGAVAKLLGVSRTKAHTLLRDGKIRSKRLAGGTHRLARPEDVIAVLEKSREESGSGPGEGHRPGED